jgi:D-xylulose kinase
MKRLFVGIDSGTQSTKSVVINGDSGEVLASATHHHTMIEGLPAGHYEQDPAVWEKALKTSLKKALAASGAKPQEVKALGISGQQHGFVPLDEKGAVIRPAKLWCDTSTTQQCEFLAKKIGSQQKVLELAGNPILPGYTAPKILWLKQVEPENFRRLRTILLPHDYLNYLLTGRFSMEHGDASGTGLLDIRARTWCETLCLVIDKNLPAMLPPLKDSWTPVGTITPSMAKSLGLSAECLVAAGGGDNMMAAIGTGNTKPGIVTASFGTSGTIFAYSPRPLIDPNGEIAAFCDSTGAWLPLVCTMNVTGVTELVKKMFSLNNDSLSRLAEKVSAGSDGLLFVPYMRGERTPNLPNGCGSWFGLNDKNFTAAHLARSAMEGVTLGMNYGLNRICQLGSRPKEIRITGGGAQNPLWRQIMADVFATPVVALKTTEGAAYGAALQALWTWKLHQGEKIRITHITDAFVKTDPTTLTTPRKDPCKRYKELQQLLDQFSKTASVLFDQHSRLLKNFANISGN